MPLALLDWRPMKRNSLRGFATIRYGSLKISDVSVHNQNGKRWANMPSKPILGQDGVAQKDESGKVKYVPFLQWTAREASDKFSEEVIEAIEREHPGETEA
jgi:hypothetical protein